MRRFLALTLALVLMTLAPASAQPPIAPIVANGVIVSTTASIGVVNTIQAQTLWAGLIPPGLLATPPAANVAAVISGVGGGQIQGFTTGPAPLHLSLTGSVQTGSSGTMQLGVNYGGGASGSATVSLINGFSPAASAGPAPFRVDCWLIPVATASATAAAPQSLVLSCRAELVSATPTQPNIFNANGFTSTTFNLASPNVMNVTWQWGAAGAGNEIKIYGSTLTIGY